MLKRLIARHVLIGIFVIFLLKVSIVVAQEEDQLGPANFKSDITNTGTTAAVFLEIGVGARAQGMGGAFTAIANDATSLYWNPAGISTLGGVSVSMDHCDWLADTRFEHFGAAIPFGNFAGFGFNVIVLDYVDEQPVRTILEPEGTGEFYSASDLAVATSFAMNLTDRFSFGLTGKYIRQTLWNESASGFAMDIGVLYQTPLRGLKLGTCMANFGTDMQLNGRDLLRAFDDDPENYSNDKLNVQLTTDKFSLPLLFRFGMSYSPIETDFHNLIFSMDLLHPSNNSESVSFGSEYRFWQTLAFRIGYNSLFEKDSENGLTVGFGISKNMIGSLHASLDYSYSDWGFLENAQRISVSLHL